MSLSAAIATLLLAGEPAAAVQAQAAPPVVIVVPPYFLASTSAPAAPASATTSSATVAASEPVPAPQQSRAGPDDDEIVVEARKGAPPGDPLAAVNIELFEANEALDKAVVGPAAEGYKKAIPEPIRAGVRNFFTNLEEPVNFINFLIQLKIGKAAETVGRFALNTTVGAAGLFDIAKRKPFNLPFRRNGFANSMGFYGIKTGAFLHIPLFGPTTVRDLIGFGLDKAVLPFAVGAPFGRPYYTIPASFVTSLDYRVEFDAQLHCFREEPDPYAASRDSYLRDRQAEIDSLRGKAPVAAPKDDTDAVQNAPCDAANVGVETAIPGAR
jgi:phospholipid-binding lipoprotein MlaA